MIIVVPMGQNLVPSGRCVVFSVRPILREYTTAVLLVCHFVIANCLGGGHFYMDTVYIHYQTAKRASTVRFVGSILIFVFVWQKCLMPVSFNF